MAPVRLAVPHYVKGSVSHAVNNGQGRTPSIPRQGLRRNLLLSLSSRTETDHRPEIDYSRPSTSFLDVVFTCLFLAPGDNGDTLIVKGRNEVFPARDFLQVCVVFVECFGVHVVVDCFKELRDSCLEVGKRDRRLRTRVTTDRNCLLLRKIIRSNFKTNRNTLSETEGACQLKWHTTTGV